MPEHSNRLRRGFAHCHAMACLGLILLAVPAEGAERRSSVVASAASPRLIGPATVAARYGYVTSGFRSVEHNRRVGGMPNSHHLRGMALDVQRRPGVTHAMIDAALRQAGYRLIESLDEIDHSHFAFADNPATLPVQNAVNRQLAGSTAAPAAPTPSKPAPPRVAADDHGVLLIDAPTLPIAAPASN